MFEDGPIRPLLAAARERVPGIELFDAHTHIGANDPDGFTCTREELLKGLAHAGDARSAVFPMHEPDGYSEANDMVIAAAADSDGVLTPYCRLDPHADPLAEAERCLDAGAAGIKLHPRAEDFPLDTPELEPVFALADERGLPVLVHAGRGIPALGRHALAVTERHPGLRLILAHCGICDLAWIWEAAPDHPNLFFDTAWWAPTDLLALFAMVPPGHIVFASDAPYGTPAFAAALHLRYAIQAGLTDDQVRLVFGGQMARILAGEEPAGRRARARPRKPARRSAARPPAHVPGRGDRADVQRRGAGRAARPGHPLLQGGGRFAPGGGVRRGAGADRGARARRAGRAARSASFPACR